MNKSELEQGLNTVWETAEALKSIISLYKKMGGFRDEIKTARRALKDLQEVLLQLESELESINYWDRQKRKKNER